MKRKKPIIPLSEKIKKKRNLIGAKVIQYEYKCIGAADQPNGCGFQWKRKKSLGHSEYCPKCGNLYFVWTNFK
jgi:hypothetical protein